MLYCNSTGYRTLRERVEELRVFIYLRVSTGDQEDNTSLEQQEIDCCAYCEENGHHVAGIFMGFSQLAERSTYLHT
jgi:Resolvase, N terminal domain